MQHLFCSNQDCRWHTESRGGVFRYSNERRGFYCDDCFSLQYVLNDAKNLWEFSTTHFNGEKIHVKNGAHLDMLCKQFGVSNQARENMEAHWNEPPSMRPQPMDPELQRFLGKASEMRPIRGKVEGGWHESQR